MNSTASVAGILSSGAHQNQAIAPAPVPSGSGPASGSGRQARTAQSRKKAQPPPVDSDSYRLETVVSNVSATGSKRSAAHERADGEPRKRKRVDHSHTTAAAFQAQTMIAPASSSLVSKSNPGGRPEGEGGVPSLFDFATLPPTSLYRYIVHHDLVPNIFPTPLSADDPPPPGALLDPELMASRAPTPAPALPMITPANRPRRSRESKEASRRRSSRLLEEEVRGGLDQIPVLADVGEIHSVLASIAQRHFKESSVKEVDTLASFMCAVKARGGHGRW